MTESSETQSVKQVGLLVVTHGEFGAALLSAAQMILGEQAGCEAVSVLVSRGVEEVVSELKSAATRLDSGLGVMILTDLFGGTPTTLSLSLLKGGNVEVVSGVNLPMLIKALQSRTQKLADMAVQVRDAGQKGIVVPGDMLRKKTAGS